MYLNNCYGPIEKKSFGLGNVLIHCHWHMLASLVMSMGIKIGLSRNVTHFWRNALGINWIDLWCSKGQLIAKAILHGFLYYKKLTKFFTFFALVSKMGQIKKIKTNNNSNYWMAPNYFWTYLKTFFFLSS